MDRQAMLSRIVPITMRRGTAADDLRPSGLANLSGLEERVALKLSLRPDIGETFFMVEHVLLRMVMSDQDQTVPLLTNVANEDPFSMQVSFVFPAKAGRFDEDEASPDRGFRDVVEHVIREETPAHLTPYVHWLSPTAFGPAQERFTRWHEIRRRTLAEKYGLTLEEPSEASE